MSMKPKPYSQKPHELRHHYFLISVMQHDLYQVKELNYFIGEIDGAQNTKGRKNRQYHNNSAGDSLNPAKVFQFRSLKGHCKIKPLVVTNEVKPIISVRLYIAIAISIVSVLAVVISTSEQFSIPCTICLTNQIEDRHKAVTKKKDRTTDKYKNNFQQPTPTLIRTESSTDKQPSATRWTE